MMKISKIIYILYFVLCSSLAYSQARITLSNNGFIVIDNGAYLNIDNSNANALSTSVGGGNIISEAETDVIKWKIGTTIGTYVIPWTTSSGVKIPLSINKTSTGTGATANFILSTWETTTDLNTPYPTAVSNMNSLGSDGSLAATDRFWHIDASSYTTKPNVTLIMNYNPAINEIGGSNTIIESNLLAQRFNTTLGDWEQSKLFGTNDAALDRVTGIVVPSADFFEDWVLVDKTSALPIKLIAFDVNCKNDYIEINWTTQTEINNDYFVVEKSYDAKTFFELTTVEGAGNSNVLQYYKVADSNPYNTTIYYRLKQVDFDGTTSFHKIVSSNCKVNEFDVNHISMNNNTLRFNILTTKNENVTINFYDYTGKIISNTAKELVEGNNTIKITTLNLSSGIYMLSILGNSQTYSTKVYKK